MELLFNLIYLYTFRYVFYRYSRNKYSKRISEVNFCIFLKTRRKYFLSNKIIIIYNFNNNVSRYILKLLKSNFYKNDTYDLLHSTIIPYLAKS